MDSSLSAAQIREKFIDFFRRYEHQYVHSSATIPLDDPTLLFANAGMNQVGFYIYAQCLTDALSLLHITFCFLLLLLSSSPSSSTPSTRPTPWPGCVVPPTPRSVSAQEANTTTWTMWVKMSTTTPSSRCWGPGPSGTTSRYETFCHFIIKVISIIELFLKENLSFFPLQQLACKMALELLTQEFGISIDRLYVTYFGGSDDAGLEPDLECKQIWIDLGLVFF